MRAPIGRRWQLALAAGSVLVGACTAVGDLGGEVGDGPPTSPTAAPPPSAPAGGSSGAPGGGAAAPAGPADEIELTRGQAGAVELDDGARLSIPAGSVLADRARVRLARSEAGTYEPAIQGEWQGRAELRLPVEAQEPPSSAFLLRQSGAGWAVQEAEARPDGFLYTTVASLSPIRTLSCEAGVATDPAGALSCLAAAGVTQLPPSLQAQLASGLGCDSSWPATALLSREAACASAPSPGGPSPAKAPPSEPAKAQASGSVAGGATDAPSGSGSGGSGGRPLTVTLTENPVVCDGGRRPFGVVSGADPGELLTFRAAEIGELRPGEANSSGQVTVHWRCDPSDVGRTWSLQAAGSSSGRTASFSFTGGPPSPPPAPTGGLQVALLGPSFACDGSRRPAGTLSGAQPGERVTFSAPGLGPLLPGTADAAGRLTVHWRCDPVHAGWTWTLQAVGEWSGRSGTFSLVGA